MNMNFTWILNKVSKKQVKQNCAQLLKKMYLYTGYLGIFSDLQNMQSVYHKMQQMIYSINLSCDHHFNNNTRHLITYPLTS